MSDKGTMKVGAAFKRKKVSARSVTGRPRSVRSANDKVTGYVKPMLAQISDKPFDDADWVFEVKWDGYRAVAETGKERTRLYSRNGLSFLRLYPRVAEELKKIKEEAILDGEIVVLNEHNKPDFQKLQQYDQHPSLPILYYVFDCISYRGKSIAELPLLERKEIARKLLPKSAVIKYSDHVSGNGSDFFSQVVSMDLEGMIAKRSDSHYLPGKRTRDWLKIKNHNTQEAVIAGYTAPRGSRQYFGALILGIFSGKKLKYIGHTGTGFNNEVLKKVYDRLSPLQRDTSPFDGRVSVNAPVTWVDPKIVCEVKFTEMTEEGILRHPVFLGLRIDKAAEETTTLDAAVKSHSRSGAPPTAHAPKKSGRKRNSATRHGDEVVISHPDKIYFPQERITKGDVVAYYQDIHRYIMPYLRNRPQSLRRTPNGIMNKGFFHKDAGGEAPDWVETVAIPSESAGKTIHYILCNNRATLSYLNNLGCIELNPWNSRVSALDRPDYLVIDLDPSEHNTFDQVIEAAQAVKEVFDKAGAPVWCKTSGASGLHLYAPLKAQYSYDEIRDFAAVIAGMTQEKLPATTTLERPLSKRKGRIYLDYQQNKRGQTVASVYSVRPYPGATVSTPLLWKEVKRGLHPSQFTMGNIRRRLERTGDLFEGVLHEKINLKKCLKNLGA